MHRDQSTFCYFQYITTRLLSFGLLRRRRQLSRRAGERREILLLLIYLYTRSGPFSLAKLLLQKLAAVAESRRLTLPLISLHAERERDFHQRGKILRTRVETFSGWLSTEIASWQHTLNCVRARIKFPC